MSFFRPHKSKPRQFNYIPRHYDPVKEEREQRRKELHGTSSHDDAEPYVPGKYIRTQREARDAARENEGQANVSKIRNMAIMAVAICLFALVLVPRFVTFFSMASDEKEANKEAEEAMRKRMKLVEIVDNIDGIDNKQEFMQAQDEMEVWKRQNPNAIATEIVEEQAMYFEIYNILESRLGADNSEALNAAYQEAIREPEQWLRDNR